jgi:hypothetical protein
MDPKINGSSALSALRLERRVDLLLDGLVILWQEFLLILGQNPERYAYDTLGELDVEPVLAVLIPFGGWKYTRPRHARLDSSSTSSHAIAGELRSAKNPIRQARWALGGK